MRRLRSGLASFREKMIRFSENTTHIKLQYCTLTQQGLVQQNRNILLLLQAPRNRLSEVHFSDMPSCGYIDQSFRNFAKMP